MHDRRYDDSLIWLRISEADRFDHDVELVQGVDPVASLRSDLVDQTGQPFLAVVEGAEADEW